MLLIASLPTLTLSKDVDGKPAECEHLQTEARGGPQFLKSQQGRFVSKSMNSPLQDPDCNPGGHRIEIWGGSWGVVLYSDSWKEVPQLAVSRGIG